MNNDDDKNNLSFIDEKSFYKEDNESKMTRRNLPHLMQDGVIYFVTFHLSDSIPAEKAMKIKQERDLWLKMNKEPYSKEVQKEYNNLFSSRIDDLLNAGNGSCLLKIKENFEIVEKALKFFDKTRYLIDEYIIMPNHVHVLVKPINGYNLKDIIHSWKSFTANKINARMGLNGQMWMHESFDHIVRSIAALEYFREYIRNNPKGRKVESDKQDACRT